MLDGFARTIIDPPLNKVGKTLASVGVRANQITMLGLLIGLGAAVAICLQNFWLGFVLIALSRIADGLDGAVARASKPTDFGGYFDIVADFIFYGAIPVAFAIADPAQNGVVTAVLLLSFYFNGATFLGFAILAERKNLSTDVRGQKNFYFTDGLMEGTETIAFLLLVAAVPSAYFWAAAIFAAATFFTGASRMVRAWHLFDRA